MAYVKTEDGYGRQINVPVFNESEDGSGTWHVPVCDTSGYLKVALQSVLDDVLLKVGTDADAVLLNRSTTLTANTAVSNVLEGTPVTPALAANSLIISNITNDGDILIAASDGGTSKAAIWIDGSLPGTYIYNAMLQSAGVGAVIQNTTDASSNQVATFGGGNRSSPTDNDAAYISFMLDNSGGTQTEFGRIIWIGTDLSTDLDSTIKIQPLRNNSLEDMLVLGYDINSSGSVTWNASNHDVNYTWGTSAGSLSLDGGTGRLVAPKDIQLSEMSAPGAGASDTVRIYAVVDGGSLTDLAAVFQDGTVDIFAQETTPLDAPIFTQPSKTEAKLVLKKEHPGSVKMVAVFPNGKEFVLKELAYHDVDKVAANKGAEGSLPSGWVVETAKQRNDRITQEQQGELRKQGKTKKTKG